MSAVVESVRSLWIPLSRMNLLVPNVAIAEVINYQPVDLVDDGPDWLLGKLRWREQELPIVSMERIFGLPLIEGKLGARISILNSVQRGAKMPFYAMVTAGIPRLFSADSDALGESVLEGKDFSNVVADCVRIGSEEAIIPNLEVIQAMIEAEWKKMF